MILQGMFKFISGKINDSRNPSDIVSSIIGMQKKF